MGNNAQLAGFCLGIKLHPGLLQNPRLDALMVNAQQIQGAADVVLFAHTLGRVALNLGADAAGNVQPFAQAGKTAA